MTHHGSGVSGIEVDAATQHENHVFELTDVRKSFSAKAGALGAVDGVDLSVKVGEFVSLLGPSGCGKSTLLNMMAGLIAPDAGTVAYEGNAIVSANTSAGYLTQDDALLPWRSVRGNIGLPLEIRGVPRAERRARVDEQIRAVGLDGFAGHYPSQLSGGMRKRVSIARTLIYQPKTLLLDEPFGALDAQTKIVLQEQLLELRERLKLTVVMVTHDINEAVKLSDRIVIFTRRPAKVKAVVAVPAARPRDLINSNEDEEKLKAVVWNNLGAELREQKQGTDGPGDAASREPR